MRKNRVQARGRVVFKTKDQGCWELCCFSSSIGAFTLQHCRHLWPLSPPITGPLRGVGTDSQGTWGSPKDHTQHRLPSDRRLELSGFCSPRRGTLAPIRCFPHTGLNPAWPWLWLPVTVALQTAQGQRLTQQPHIRHGSSHHVNAKW